MPEPGLEIGDLLPDTNLHLRLRLGDGPLLVLFFSEANTPLCTTQLCAFRDDFEMLAELGADVVAVSTDSEAELARFREEHLLPFPLLSDADLSAAEAFGVADRVSKRAQRAAFVADRDGVVQLAIPFYQPTNFEHYQQIFEALGLDV